MALKSVLDVREAKLKDVWEQTRVPLESQALPIGDWCMYKDEEPVCIVERKSLADLHASLRDGRWTEQKARIQSNRGNAVVVYVIEDDGRTRLDESTGWKISCILGTQIRDNIHVMQTKSVKETFNVIAKLWSKLSEGSWAPVACDSKNPSLFPTRALKKIDNATPAAVWRSQLACIPRVSMAIADKVAEVYPSLWDMHAKNPSEESLASIRISEKRRLGPALARAISGHLLASPSPQPCPEGASVTETGAGSETQEEV